MPVAPHPKAAEMNYSFQRTTSKRNLAEIIRKDKVAG